MYIASKSQKNSSNSTRFFGADVAFFRQTGRKLANSGKNGEISAKKQFANQINFHLYHYAGNNPVKYLDPDGKNIKNNQRTYIIARLEDSLGLTGEKFAKIPLYDAKTGSPITDKNGKQKYIDYIDTLVLAPGEVGKGGYDGAKDINGNYFKITARNKIIDFEVNYESLTISSLGDYYINKLGDDFKSLKNIVSFFRGKTHDILSGFKNKDSIDAKLLANKWDVNFDVDCGHNYKDWIESYNSNTQFSLRKYLNESEN